MSDDFKMDFSAEIEAARKKRVNSFKLEIEPYNSENEDDVAFDEETGSSENVAETTDNSEKPDLGVKSAEGVMSDDFSEKYSLHKYTDADQIEDNDSNVVDFVGEERAVVDSDEISSFSNAEQKHRMDKEERKAIKAYKKSDKKRQKEKAEKNSAMFRLIWFCMVLAVSVVLGMFLWNGISDVLGISREEGETIIVEVPENATFEQIVSMLTENQLINEEAFFRLYATVTKSTDGFEEGIKTMRPNMDYEEILNTLQSGPSMSETVTVQFKEGMTVRQVAEALEDKKVCKAEKFLELCNSDMFDEEYSFLAEIPKDENCVYKLEGYLFPDTYEFYIGEDADDSIRRFLDNFEYKICTSTSTVSGYTDAVSIETIIKDKGMTLNEVVKMSSLVQAEAANINDMYVVSSVFYNRLDTIDNGGVSPYGDYDLDKLKSDATLYYPYDAQEDIPSDVAATFKSNYNTYNISGMPPGAICNPGLDAIDAAINPDNTDYYYFCHKAPTETDGATPYYASTFAEHQVNLVEAGLA